MRRNQQGFILKAVLWLAGLAILAVAAIFGINATDEDLSEATKKALAVAPPPKPSPQNGYTDNVELARMSLDDRLKRSCGAEPGRCLENAKEDQERVKLNVRNDAFMTRYLAMRAKPEFVDLDAPKGPYDPIPGVSVVFWGQARALLYAADLANHGQLEAAVAELEAENEFHRRAAAGARSLIVKIIVLISLQRDAFFASELARIPGPQAKAMLPRLRAIVRPLSAAEMDVRKNLEIDRSYAVSWMQTRRYARPSDEYYEMTKSFGEERPRPWWSPVAEYLYRPHQSVNLYVAQTDVLNRVAEVPAARFETAVEEAVEKARALAPRGLLRHIVNPAGRDHPYLGDVTDGRSGGGTTYIGRGHAAQAVYTMVRLQIALREAGLTSREAIERAADGPLFQAHFDPFTGKPMSFRANTQTVGFVSPVAEVMHEALIKLYGRVAVPVMIEF